MLTPKSEASTLRAQRLEQNRRAEPLVVTEVRWACPWCNQTESWKPTCVEHMKVCPMRPAAEVGQ